MEYWPLRLLYETTVCRFFRHSVSVLETIITLDYFSNERAYSLAKVRGCFPCFFLRSVPCFMFHGCINVFDWLPWDPTGTHEMSCNDVIRTFRKLIINFFLIQRVDGGF